MSDAFYELLVSRKKRPIDRFGKVFVIILIAFLVASSFYIGIWGILGAVILGVLAYFFIFPRLSVEFEYSLVNRDLTIDVIYDKMKRKTIYNLDLAKVEIVAPKNSHRLDSYRNLKIKDYSANDPNTPPYAVIFPMEQTLICCLLQLDEKLISQLSYALPRKFFQD